MSKVPDGLVPYERWVNRDTFTIRRRVLTETTTRGSAKHHTHLPSVFEGAHPWPLMWGGPEVTEAHFFAHHDFNTSLQKRWELAVRRFAERLQGTEYYLYAVVTVERYGQRNLLKSYNARLELVHGYSGDVTRLVDVAAEQSFTREQLRALVEGKIVQGQHGGNFLIQHKGKQVRIRLDRMILLPNPGVYGPTSRAEALVRGVQTVKEAAKDTPSPGQRVTPTPLARPPAAVRQQTGPALTRKAVENRALAVCRREFILSLNWPKSVSSELRKIA